MIQRFCFVKLLDDEVPARAEIAAQLAAQLRAAGADAVVGLPADDSAIRWDISVVITCASLEAWHALPVGDVLAQLADRAAVIKAWSFAAV